MIRDLAVDLGSATTRVLVRAEDAVIAEPSVVARVADSGEVIAWGGEAARMVGRTPAGIETVVPFRHGSVVDLPAARALVRGVLRLAGIRRRHRVRAVVSVPTTMTPVEQGAVVEALRAAGAAEIHLIGHTMAAALGRGLPLDQPVGSLVVDVGAGTSEAAVLSLGGVVAQEWRRVGGDDVDRAIQRWVEERHGLVIDGATAEEAKRLLVGHGDEAVPPSLAVRGRVIGSGAAAEVTLTGPEVDDAVDDAIRSIVDVVVACAGWTPPEIANDLLVNGVHLVGGGARLRGLADRAARASRLPVRVADEPEEVGVRGGARCLGNLRGLDELFLDSVGAST